MTGTALVGDGEVDTPDPLPHRMRMRHPVVAQLIRFTLVSGFSTAVNATVFLVARIWWDTLPANLLALVVSTLVGTEVNRRFTFEAGLTRRWRTYVQNGGTVVVYAFYSSAVLLTLDMMIDDPTPVQQTVAVSTTGILIGLARFLLLRSWVFGAEDGPRDVPSEKHTPHVAR